MSIFAVNIWGGVLTIYTDINFLAIIKGNEDKISNCILLCIFFGCICG